MVVEEEVVVEEDGKEDSEELLPITAGTPMITVLLLIFGQAPTILKVSQQGFQM